MSGVSYDRVTKTFHWFMAIIIVYTTMAGYGMHLTTYDSPMFHFLSTLNMSLATVAAPVFLARWVWKYFRPSLEDDDSIAHWQKSIAKLTHSLMYFMMSWVFISGFLMLESSYHFFWMVEVSNLIKQIEISSFFFKVHRLSCLTLAVLVTLHILAVAHHHLVRKNNVLKLML
ncbi:cytochrome b [Vibrio coralliilyticus]|uniref:cytochrome b n=1 Tax=Vibrio coralliilyticus TaxID=190893 RepID=UPI00148BB520|nr:cytochrome b/b6 domain-containing protein [Vibrio coralliilyticus]NOI28853.1 cytochrome b [Vibrio coralliilyticus]NOI47747.1 cytochrome b [Vibrio coralliilyticus]